MWHELLIVQRDWERPVCTVQFRIYYINYRMGLVKKRSDPHLISSSSMWIWCHAFACYMSLAALLLSNNNNVSALCIAFYSILHFGLREALACYHRSYCCLSRFVSLFLFDFFVCVSVSVLGAHTIVHTHTSYSSNVTNFHFTIHDKRTYARKYIN